MNLRLDWCGYDAAKYAVTNWHYSRAMPAGKIVKIGVWEDENFIGCVIFGRGANNNLAKSFGLSQIACIELVRIALTNHQSSVSQIVSIALKMLKKQSPGIKLVVSYADYTNQKHFGTIYQAGNWLYLGERYSKGAAYYIIAGKKMHGRTVRSKWGSEKNIPYPWKYADEQMKHLYIYPLDNVVRAHYDKLQKPYPKCAESVDSDTSGFQSEKGSANLTSALQRA